MDISEEVVDGPGETQTKTQTWTKVTMAATLHCVAASVGDQRIAIPLRFAQRAYAATQITSLPRAPEHISGVVEVQGRLVPVLDLRGLLDLDAEELNPDQEFLLVRASGRELLLHVDRVEGMVSRSGDELMEARQLVVDAPWIRGAIRLPDGLIWVHDADAFLTRSDVGDLDGALEGLS